MEKYQDIRNIPFIGEMVSNQREDDLETQQERMVANMIIEKYSEELNNREDLLKKFEIISNELIKMGFNPKMILRAFLVHKYSTLEEGVEVLSKNPDGLWNHKFVDYFNDKCFICSDLENVHRSLRTILSRKINIDEEKVKTAIIRQQSMTGSYDKKTSLVIQSDSCPICFIEITSDMSFNLSCQHKFCKDCILSYLEEEIRNAKVGVINCPQKGCDTQFTENLIKEIVLDEDFQKYLKFKEREKIKDMKNVIHCPIVDCEGYAVKSEEEVKEPIIEDNPERKLLEEDAVVDVSNELKDKIKYICNNGHPFCGKCKCVWHDDDCNEDREVKDFATSTGKIIKRCPKCKVWTEKIEGCNHMTCHLCKFEWCWLCSKTYTPSHYSEPGPCFGRQFNDEADPLLFQLINFENNNPFIYNIFFVYIYTFFLISLIVRNTLNPINGVRRISKCTLFWIVFLLLWVVWFFCVFLNGFLTLYMVKNLQKIRELNTNGARLIGGLTYFFIFIAFYIPGILFSTIWLFVSLNFLAIKICAA